MKPSRVWVLDAFEDGEWVLWSAIRGTHKEATIEKRKMGKLWDIKFRVTPYEPVKSGKRK